MKRTMSTAGAMALGLLLVLLAACSGGPSRPDPKMLDQTLDAYDSAVRWKGLDASVRYLDPEQVAARPPSEFDLERLRQVEVVNYQVVSRIPIDATHVDQLVDIELSNKNNQTARTVRVHQKWSFDAKARRWWLSSLPDISAK